MPETLLSTKFYIPPLSPSLIPRPHLIERLNQGLLLGSKLTLISAPAGFGKTSLVSEWVNQKDEGGRIKDEKLEIHPSSVTPHPSNVAWLSLDEGDNDPARFLTYLVAALSEFQGQGDTVGQGALTMLQSSRPPPDEDVLVVLINDIATVTGKIILVLDDYHVIDSAPVDDALDFLLEHQPPSLHLVIATRADPNFSLSRYRAQGRLTELRAAELRFSFSEAASFLNDSMGLNLSEEDINALETRTEGWIVGLHLAALALRGSNSDRGQDDVARFINSFTGSHHFVLDYLIEEVIEQQTESDQTFLLRTAVLGRLNGSLCDVLTGSTDGQVTLETLDRENLFIVRLDGERRWYRYHHLFSDLLRQRLRQTRPELEPELHRRASVWYENNGYADEAIEHALQAGHYDQAARLIEKHIDTLWGRGENRKLQRWLAGLPEDILFFRPSLAIFQARYLCNSGRLDEAEQTLNAAEKTIAASPSKTGSGEQPPITRTAKKKLLGRIASTRAIMSSYRGDVSGIIDHASRALDYLPEGDLIGRSVTAIVLGNAHGFLGDMAAAYEARYQALKACESAGDIYFIILADLEVAITLREQGRLRQTLEICQRRLQYARENGLATSRVVGWLMAIWGETLAEMGDPDTALDRAKKGFEMTGQSGDLQMFGWSFMCLIRTLYSRRELSDAEAIIQQMDQVGRTSTLPPWIANQVLAWQARIWLAQNKVENASKWVRERGLEPDWNTKPASEIDFFLLFDYLVLARVLIAQGHLEEAIKLLNTLLMAAEMGGRTSKVIEITALQALTFQAQGEPEHAFVALESALTLAEPEGFVRVFLDEGRPMVELLAMMKVEGRRMKDEGRRVIAYIDRLLAAYEMPGDGQALITMLETPPDSISPPPAQAGQPLIEPLSERELEVLELIADGLTNREIADRLYLSTNTVKVHTRNIYGKIDVHSRTQAIARSMELGLLPQRRG